MKSFLFFTIILISNLCMSVETTVKYTVKGHYKNTPFRVDDDLEKVISGEECFNEFKSKKGRIIVLNPNDEQIEKFVVKPGDDIRIGCSAGWCRSQTAYLIFQMFDGIKLLPPHGTRYFFDTPGGIVLWSKNLVHEVANDEFFECFGVAKANRVGEKEFAHLRYMQPVPQELLDKATAFYDAHYFGPESVDPQTKRVVYITFAINAHAILHRLNQTNTNLERHVVVCLELEDFISSPPKRWNTYGRSTVGYTKFAKLLMKFFDFSQLELKKEAAGMKIKQIVLD